MIGELLPDKPDRDNPGVIEARNVCHYADAYHPVRSFVTDTNALTGPCLGATVLLDAQGAVYNYAGDATDIYTRTGNVYGSVQGGYSGVQRWEFSRFFDTVLAANGVDKLQSGSFGGAMADIVDAPVCMYLTVARNFTIVGNLSTDVSAVAWSALGDPTNWTTIEADSQHLDEAGAVTRVMGGEYVVVVCQRGIYRMSYVGPPAQWQFDLVESERGCLYPGMVVKVGYSVYFLADNGFYVFDGNASRPISSGKLSNTFYADFDRASSHLCTSISDLENNLIWFTYPGSGHTGTANRAYVYDYVTGKWSGPIERDVQQLVYSLSPATGSDVIPPGDELCDDPPWDATLCDDASFGGGEDPEVTAFIPGNTHAIPVGGKLPALIESGEYALTPDDYTLVNGFRPIVDGPAPSVAAAIDYRNKTSEAVTRNTLTAINDRTGMVDQRVNARYHRFRVAVSGDFDTISGGEPIVRSGGR